jgi:hypothetical protein
MRLPPELSFEEWITVGRELGEQQDTLFWRIGDWWVWGDHHHGDRKALIEGEAWEDLIGRAYSTCAHAATAVRAFPEESCRRRQLLTPSHHLEVADLLPPQADALLDWAEEPVAKGGQRRSVRELREEKRRRKPNLRSTPTFGIIEPKPLIVTVKSAPMRDPEELVLMLAAAVPRHEFEVQRQLGEAATPGRRTAGRSRSDARDASSQSSTDQEARELALAGFYAALRRAVSADLREQLQHCVRMLAPAR